MEQAQQPHTELLDCGTRVLTAPGATFGTDALLLARFTQPGQNKRAIDLCSGCGIVALAWHDAGWRGPGVALELDGAASALCAESILANGPQAAHLTAVCADLRRYALAGTDTAAENGRYDFVACNPPYFTGGPRSANAQRATARHADCCTTQDLALCAARLLHDGGKLALCQRPDQLAAVMAALCAVRLEPKRIAFVKNRADGAPWLFLLEAQKGRRPGLVFQPDILLENGTASYGPAANRAAAPAAPAKT